MKNGKLKIILLILGISASAIFAAIGLSSCNFGGDGAMAINADAKIIVEANASASLCGGEGGSAGAAGGGDDCNSGASGADGKSQDSTTY